MFKQLMHKILRRLGYRLQRIESRNNHSMAAALQRLAGNDFNIQTIIDIGAAKGSWSAMARQSFPTQPIMAFEPLKEYHLSVRCKPR